MRACCRNGAWTRKSPSCPGWVTTSCSRPPVLRRDRASGEQVLRLARPRRGRFPAADTSDRVPVGTNPSLATLRRSSPPPVFRFAATFLRTCASGTESPVVPVTQAACDGSTQLPTTVEDGTDVDLGSCDGWVIAQDLAHVRVSFHALSRPPCPSRPRLSHRSSGSGS
jgi:hypothetical protein